MSRNISAAAIDHEAPLNGAARLEQLGPELAKLGIFDVRFSLGGVRKHTPEQIYNAVADVIEAVIASEGSNLPDPLQENGYGLKP